MYKATGEKLWTGRIDEEDGKDGLRWHQVVRLGNAYKDEAGQANPGDIALLGLASDEGVKRNKGRLGAAEGPFSLRKALASMAWHHGSDKKIIDFGDVYVSYENLEQAQSQVGEITAKLMDRGYLPVVLGGGHEVAWASFQGYVQSNFRGKRLGIINFDAHFDLRKAEKASSGTPFLQMAHWHKNSKLPFRYLCLGIQKYGNTKALFNTADELGVEYVFSEEMNPTNQAGISAQVDRFMSQVDHIYLSIDLDGFDGAYAPGVSAPSIGGMSPAVVFPLVKKISRSGKLLVMDVAELNPSLDQDMRTAKLGGRCIFEALC